MRWVDTLKVDCDYCRLMELAQDHAHWRAVALVLVLVFAVSQLKLCSVPLFYQTWKSLFRTSFRCFDIMTNIS
jgi:predicted membrane channel-forming protein YqfA (hemolysin III family)